MPAVTLPRQHSFPTFCPITEAVSILSESDAKERGAIYTRREVVEFILDLVGYTSDRPFYKWTPAKTYSWELGCDLLFPWRCVHGC